MEDSGLYQLLRMAPGCISLALEMGEPLSSFLCIFDAWKSILSSPPRPGLAAHCFKCHAGDFLQGVPEYLQPLLLSKRVLLGANHVDIMWDIIGRVVPRLSLSLGEKPGRDLLGRGCVTFNSKTQHQVS